MTSGSTKVTVSPATLPSFTSASRFCPSSSAEIFLVTAVPSCLSVNVYFCRPRGVSKSAFQVPVRSAATREQGNAASARKRCEGFMGGFFRRGILVLEQQRRENLQAAAPGEEFVRGVFGNERGVLDADFFQRVVIRVDVRVIL